MSGSPKNIQRDAIFVAPAGQDSNASSAVGVITNPSITSGIATVYPDFSSVSLIRATFQNIAAGSMKCLGVAMPPPNGDRNPYRVKAFVSIPGLPGSEHKGFIMIGYLPASPTGVDDAVEESVLIPFISSFDDLIMVEQLVPSHILEGRALSISVCIAPSATLASSGVTAHISVQNLGVKPPTMQNAVS
jgi:hypothetical protein